MRRNAPSTRRSLLAGLGSGIALASTGCTTLQSIVDDDSGTQMTPLPAAEVGLERERDVTFRQTPSGSLALDVTRPDDGIVRPLLVHVHGGGWRLGSKGYAHADRMARAGMVVASIEYRLSGTAIYPAAVRDVVAAIQWLRGNADERDIDPGHTALVGESAGGHLAALVASAPTHSAFRPREFDHDGPVGVDAVVPISGIYDLTLGWMCNAEITQQFLGGTCEDVPERAREASPVTHADAADPPVLCYHATADPIVSYEQATNYRDRLRAAGVDLELYTVEGGGHTLNTQADAFLPEQRRFLQRSLGIERGIQE